MENYDFKTITKSDGLKWAEGKLFSDRITEGGISFDAGLDAAGTTMTPEEEAFLIKQTESFAKDLKQAVARGIEQSNTEQEKEDNL